jgi:hypothetical protein
MTRFIHDQFAKDYLEELLKNCGKVEAPMRVAGEVREIDVYFSPYPEANPNIQLLGLWIRMLGRGNVQKQAIDELAQLPEDYPFRRITLELLYNLQTHIRLNQNAEDREIVMRLAPLYQQERQLAIEEGKIEGETLLIIRQLNRRIGQIESRLIDKIQKLPIEKLETLGEDLLDFTKVEDLETWLNQN